MQQNAKLTKPKTFELNQHISQEKCLNQMEFKFPFCQFRDKINMNSRENLLKIVQANGSLSQNCTLIVCTWIWSMAQPFCRIFHAVFFCTYAHIISWDEVCTLLRNEIIWKLSTFANFGHVDNFLKFSTYLKISSEKIIRFISSVTYDFVIIFKAQDKVIFQQNIINISSFEWCLFFVVKFCLCVRSFILGLWTFVRLIQQRNKSNINIYRSL